MIKNFISISLLSLSFLFACLGKSYASTITADFLGNNLGSNIVLESGEELDFPLDVTGFINSPVTMEVTFIMIDSNGDVAFTYTAPSQLITTPFFTTNQGVGATTVTLVTPEDEAFNGENLCVQLDIHYSSGWNALNDVRTEFNGTFVATSSFGTNGEVDHTINNAFCFDYEYVAPCFTLTVISGYHGKTSTWRYRIVPSGGSGQYGFIWSNGQTGNAVSLSCGCVTVTVTDLVTGCDITIDEGLCAPAACASVQPNRISNAGAGNIILHAYPNPASHYVKFELNTPAENAIAELVDMKGSVIQRITIGDEATGRFNLSETVTGMYVLQVRDGGIVLGREKIIINK